jgi:hypothetical protein
MQHRGKSEGLCREAESTRVDAAAHGDAPVSTQLLILAGAALAGLLILDSAHDRASARRDSRHAAELQACRADAAKANQVNAQLARSVAGCLNGEAITDGEFVADCRPAR